MLSLTRYILVQVGRGELIPCCVKIGAVGVLWFGGLSSMLLHIRGSGRWVALNRFECTSVLPPNKQSLTATRFNSTTDIAAAAAGVLNDQPDNL